MKNFKILIGSFLLISAFFNFEVFARETEPSAPTATPVPCLDEEPLIEQCEGEGDWAGMYRCCLSGQCYVNNGYPSCADLCGECSTTSQPTKCCGKKPVKCIPYERDCCVDTKLNYVRNCAEPEFCCGNAVVDDPVCYEFGKQSCCKATDDKGKVTIKVCKEGNCCVNSTNNKILCKNDSDVCCGGKGPTICPRTRPQCCPDRDGIKCCQADVSCEVCTGGRVR